MRTYSDYFPIIENYYFICKPNTTQPMSNKESRFVIRKIPKSFI